MEELPTWNERHTRVWLTAVFLSCAIVASAAKPTDAFKSAIKQVWEPRAKTKDFKGGTFAVVEKDGLFSASTLGLVSDGINAKEGAEFRQKVIAGSLETPDLEEQKKRKAWQPLERGTVVQLWYLSFKGDGVELELWDSDQHVVPRRGTTNPRPETFSVALRFVFPPGQRLDHPDAAMVLDAIAQYVKPFASEAAAKAYAGTVSRPSP